MKKIHRIFVMGLAVVFLMVSFSGCGGSKKAEPVSKKKDKYVIGFTQIGSESEWRVANTEEIMAAYKAHPRFEILFSDAQQKQENQIAAMRNFIQQKVDAILLPAIVSTGWDAVLHEAKDAGIPVINYGRLATVVTGKPEDFFLCMVSPDNVYAGEVLAETFIKSFGNDPGPINVIELTGTVGASSTIDRAKGIHNVMDKQNRVVIKYTQTGDYTRSTAKQVMESILKTAQTDKVQIRGLISHNDDMAIGASQAIVEAGLKPGVDIKIVGIDGVRGAFEAMVEGKYTATVENPLGYGDETIRILLDYLDNGKKPEPFWQVLKNAVFTEKEAAAALPTRKY